MCVYVLVAAKMLNKVVLYDALLMSKQAARVVFDLMSVDVIKHLCLAIVWLGDVQIKQEL